MIKNNYRPDIDGLRAITVLSVVFFHIDPLFLPGGFVGVDVFFVISGFLITSLVHQDLIKQKFCFKAFYIKRIRRIIPVLLLMLAVTSIVSFFILTPEHLYAYAKTLLAQPLSLQNFVFLSEGEYFLKSDGKPLLHTWSLAVEEQFYLFWPVLLYFLIRLRSLFFFTILVGLLLASFSLNLFFSSSSEMVAFYLLPSRAWELTVGGLTAIALLYFQKNKKMVASNALMNLLPLIGFLLLLGSFIFLNSKMQFPGYIALIPVLGTVCILFSFPTWHSLVKQLLASQVAVKIGLISYSLYLWHWPILAFLTQLEIDKSTWPAVVFIVVLSFVLSMASYRWLERPIIEKQLFRSNRSLFTFVLSSVVVLIAFSVHILTSKGASYRYDGLTAAYLGAMFDSQKNRCGPVFRALHPKTPVCELTSVLKPSEPSQKVLLWGNSHADMWSQAFISLAEKNNDVLLLNARNCRATVSASECKASIPQSVLQYVLENKISDVIFASSWPGLFQTNTSHYEYELSQIVGQLQAKNIRVWLLVDIPVAQALDPLLAYRKNPQQPQAGSIPLQEYKAASYDAELTFYESLAVQYEKVFILNTKDVFCDKQRCWSAQADQVWYRDSGHVSNTGALKASPVFEPVFQSK